jgi:hypothetical protein
MKKFCGRDMTEPLSQGTHSPAVPAYKFFAATHPLHFFHHSRLRRLRWLDRSLELASKRGKKQCPFLDSNQGSFHYDEITSETLSRRVSEVENYG